MYVLLSIQLPRAISNQKRHTYPHNIYSTIVAKKISMRGGSTETEQTGLGRASNSTSHAGRF